jgi:hypothetical protein
VGRAGAERTPRVEIAAIRGEDLADAA